MWGLTGICKAYKALVEFLNLVRHDSTLYFSFNRQIACIFFQWVALLLRQPMMHSEKPCSRKCELYRREIVFLDYINPFDYLLYLLHREGVFYTSISHFLTHSFLGNRTQRGVSVLSKALQDFNRTLINRFISPSLRIGCVFLLLAFNIWPCTFELLIFFLM